ncbi:hypothetical protein GCM10007159_29140 [Modicisalibacter luteus]|nr:hypothetical protein GCM10007159_29140 [Halomonas lutea]
MLWVITGIVISIVLGYISYNYIENVARKKKTSLTKSSIRPLIRIGAPTTVAAIFSAAIIFSDGYPKRMSDDFYATMEKLDLPRVTNGWCFYDVNTNEHLPIGSKGLECRRGERNSALKGLLFGDSFAGHYGPFWDQLGKELSAEVNSVTTNWCYPSTNDVIYGDVTSRSYDQCLVNRKYFLENASGYDFVVLSGSWKKIYSAEQMQGVYDAISYAARQSKLVIVMATPTYFDVDVRKMYVRSVLFDIDFDINEFSKVGDLEAVEANKAIENFTKNYANVFYMDRSSLFHVNGVPSEVTEENIPYSFDQHGHISIYGSVMAATSFIKSHRYNELAERITEVQRNKSKNLVFMNSKDSENSGSSTL